MLKKELTKIQTYAITAAKAKATQVNLELQSLLRDVAVELGIDMNDPKGGRWRISEDSKYLERLDVPPKIPKEIIPKGKKKSK